MKHSPSQLVFEFARRLGWHDLMRYTVALTADICGSHPVGTIVVGYSTNDLKFFLQINESPVGQGTTYQATIVAERYGLRPIGWHSFALPDYNSMVSEAVRLEPMLARSILRNPTSRRKFVREHVYLLWRERVGRRKYRRLTQKA